MNSSPTLKGAVAVDSWAFGIATKEGKGVEIGDDAAVVARASADVGTVSRDRGSHNPTSRFQEYHALLLVIVKSGRNYQS